jgi:hypothetical protein
MVVLKLCFGFVVSNNKKYGELDKLITILGQEIFEIYRIGLLPFMSQEIFW